MSMMLTFLEGLMSFASPCALPMLPVYVAYFSAGGRGRGVAFARALAFALGLATVFVALGVFAGSVGSMLAAHRAAVDAACGSAVVLFGLGYLGLFRLPFSGKGGGRAPTSVLSAFLFGLAYSASLTPCVGAFLGAALMQAASEGGAARGAALLLAYSLGLGAPFVVSAVMLERLRGAFSFIRSRYGVINPVCGAVLVLLGAWMIAAPWVRTAAGGASADSGAADGKDARASSTEQCKEQRKEGNMEIELTSANFEEEVLKSDRPALVDFWAPWCGPCRMLGPIVAEVARERAGSLKVCKVNVDEAPDLAARYGITGIPALFLFKDGQVAAQSVGFMGKPDLERFVSAKIP